MAGLVELWANQIGWRVRDVNVIVEGSSDVQMLEHAAELYSKAKGVRVLGPDFGIIAAGKGDDGGVDGVNRRLNAARQIADADRAADGALRHRFIGLFDNDEAGRRAVSRASGFDRRIAWGRDVFLLRPVMPVVELSMLPELSRQIHGQNLMYEHLDWEIEDLVSEGLSMSFEVSNPRAILSKARSADKVHRNYSRDGKVDFRKFVLQRARLPDLVEMVRLLRALRCYAELSHHQIAI